MGIFLRLAAIFIGLSILLTALAGCGSRTGASTPNKVSTPALTQEQATAIGHNALQAINAGDYAAYSRDWSDAMKAGIKEADFQAWRTELMNANGTYQSINNVELAPAKKSGYVRWVFTSTFEKRQLRYILTFKQDGDKVEGAFVEPVS